MNRLLTMSVLLCLTGCVSTAIVPVEKGASEGMQGRAITVTHREKPSFAAMTAGKASFALIGAFAMISVGNATIKENDIEDPAVRIAHELSDAMIKAHALRSLDNTVAAASGDPAALAKQYPMADLLLDVQTIN